MPVSGRQTERHTAELSFPRKPEMPLPCKSSPGGTWTGEHHATMPECEGKERLHFSFTPLHIHTPPWHSLGFF